MLDARVAQAFSKKTISVVGTKGLLSSGAIVDFIRGRDGKFNAKNLSNTYKGSRKAARVLHKKLLGRTILCNCEDSKFDGSSVTWVGLDGVQIDSEDPKAVLSWGRYWTLRETNIDTPIELKHLAQYSMHSISRSHQRMDCADADVIVHEVASSLISVAVMGELVKRLNLKQVFAPTNAGIFVGHHTPNDDGAPHLDFRTYLDYERLSPRWIACTELFENAVSAVEAEDLRLLVMDPFADLSASMTSHIDGLIERLSKREYSWLREEYQPRFDPDRLAWEAK